MNRPMLPPTPRPDRRRFLKSFAACALSGSSLRAVEQNKWEKIVPFFEPPKEWRGQYGDYRSPLIFKDGSKVETAADWARRRKEIREDWMSLMGKDHYLIHCGMQAPLLLVQFLVGMGRKSA